MSEPRVKLADFLVGVKKLGIAGHVWPDGDCVGSCMGLYLYITENYPDIETHVYMEEPKGRFDYIKALAENFYGIKEVV